MRRRRRGQETVEQFAGSWARTRAILRTSGSLPGHVAAVPGRGARQPPEGEVTFDRYHVKQKLEAIDASARRGKEHKELLKNTRYLWLKRPQNLTAKQLDWLDQLLQHPLDLRAYEQD